ncbi:MAG: hypothetical protein ACREON_07030 [Gemmatimonadaceae bacterium]
MPEVPFPQSYAAAQHRLLRELEDECRALRGARTLDLVRLRTVVEEFAREVKDQGGSVERMLALLRACLRSAGISDTSAATAERLNERTFQWALDAYFGPKQGG